MADEQIPRLADLLAPGIDALLEHRPRAARHIPQGRYGAAVKGLEAQAALCRARLASEVASARLELAELGQPLFDLVQEFGAIVDPTPKKAIGEVLLVRTIANNSNATSGNWGNFGVIPKGSRFRRPADPNAAPPRSDASYTTVEPVLVADEDSTTLPIGGGVWQHTQSVLVPIVAEKDGVHANTVIVAGLANSIDLPGQIVDPLFDTTFTVARLSAAGGSTGPTRAALIQYARAAYSGQYGPTDMALIAGAFSFGGVSRVALELDEDAALARLWVTDESWGGDRRFAEAVFNHIVTNDYLGFGGAARVAFITNTLVSVRATVIMASPEHGLATTELSENVRKKVAAYFNDRPDWWTWKTQALRGVIARADRRILTCSEATVLGSDGAPVAEPRGQILGLPIHYLLSGAPLALTFRSPS
jgi:hypothetical protein